MDNTLSGPVEVLTPVVNDCLTTRIRDQEARKAALRFFPLTPRKPRKILKQADVDAAVNEKLDELDREFRRLGVEFPKFAKAFDVARVAVKSARKCA